MQPRAQVFVAKISNRAGPTFQVAKYLARDEPPAIAPSFTMPSLGIIPPGAEEFWGTASRTLLDLPQNPESFPFFLGREVEEGLGGLWQSDGETGLRLPESYLRERAFERSWSADHVVAPSTVDIPFSPGSMARVAWQVLLRVGVERVVKLALSVSFRSEVFGWRHPLAVTVVESINLPPAFARKALAEVRTGRPFLNPRCLRWIAREIAAWNQAGRPALDDSDANLEDELLATVFFARVLKGMGEPTDSELVKAFWFLQEGFHGAEIRDEDLSLDSVTSLIAALGFGIRQSHEWAQRMARWHAIWMIDDDHPALLNNDAVSPRTLPTPLRAAAESQLAMTVHEWFALGFTIVARHFTWTAQGNPHIALPEFLKAHLNPLPIRDEAMASLERWLVIDLEELGQEVIDDTERWSGGYRGLGSTRQHETRVLRDRPYVRLPEDGAWVPAGFYLLVDRFDSVPRAAAAASCDFKGDADRLVGGGLGFLMEAYVHDVLDKASRHVVVHDSTLRRVLPEKSRSDAVLAYTSETLAIETSIQRLSEGVAAGHTATIRKRCRAYVSKANQARSTLVALPRVRQQLRLPRALVSSYLVVTDLSLPLTQAIAEELTNVDSTINPKFVITLDELELLVGLGNRGWSIPSLVLAWQESPYPRPLLSDLLRRAEMTGVDPYDLPDIVSDWLRDLPLEKQEIRVA